MIDDRYDWSLLPEEEARQVAAAALFDGNRQPLEGIDTAGWSAEPSFLDGATFCRLTFKPRQVAFTLYCFWDGSQASPLNGTSAPFFQLGAEGHLDITEESAPEYLWLYCIAMQGTEGSFQVVEPPEEVGDGRPEDGESDGEDGASAYAELIEPIRVLGPADDGRLIVEATVFYAQQLYRTRFAADLETGAVEMLSDESIAEGLPENAFGEPPTFHPIGALKALLLRAGASGGSARILRADPGGPRRDASGARPGGLPTLASGARTAPVSAPVRGRTSWLSWRPRKAGSSPVEKAWCLKL